MNETSKVERLLAEYGESHRNSTNKTIHWICVPLIFFSIFGLLRTIPVPEVFSEISRYLNWASIILLLALIYYLFLHLILFFGFVIWSFIVTFGNEFIVNSIGINGLLWVSIAIFVLAWIGQFVGHHIEGKKPSFLKDLQFLLIGPAWLMNFILKVIPYK